MYCKSCWQIYGPLGETSRKIGKHNKYTKAACGTFVSGCSNIKHDALVVHSKSKSHKDATERVIAGNAFPGTSQAEKIIVQMNQAMFQKLSKLFRNAHAIAKHARLFANFQWMADLDEAKGIDLGKTYLNDKNCRVFVHSIAQMERQKVWEVMDKAQYITVLLDGSSDIAAIENEIVYVHYAFDVKMFTAFAGLVAVEKANAPGIFDVINKALHNMLPSNQQLSSFMKKIICYCSDGAAVNTGYVNGVISILEMKFHPI